MKYRTKWYKKMDAAKVERKDRLEEVLGEKYASVRSALIVRAAESGKENIDDEMYEIYLRCKAAGIRAQWDRKSNRRGSERIVFWEEVAS